MALTLTVTFHFSFAYSAKALSAASWMNLDTGVISTSSLSMGAWPPPARRDAHREERRDEPR